MHRRSKILLSILICSLILGLTNFFPNKFIETEKINYKNKKLDDNKGLIDGWDYWKKITINHNLVEGDLTNFPILYVNTSTDFSSHAQSDGDDFLFTTSDNLTQLNHEIERYTSGTGEIIAWVNITSLSGSTDTIIHLFYGNSGASNQEHIEDTWDGNYFAVLHMDGADVTEIMDSTAYNHDATSDSGSPSYQQTGQIGYAVDFQPGTPDCEIELDQVYSATNNSDDILTVEVWLNPDSSNTYYFIAQHQTAGSDGILAQYRANNLETYFDSNSNLEYGMTQVNNWFYVCFKQDSNVGVDQRHLFINETEVDTEPGAGITWNAGQNFHIANRGAGAREFDGTIDELRLHNVSRSDAWIITSYNTVNDSENFITVSAEKTVSTNQAPTQSAHKTWKVTTSEEVSLSGVDVDFRPTRINVTINDQEGDTMNLTFRTNQSGTWQDADSNLSIGNGTYYCLNNSWIDLYYTTYWMSFNVTDGVDWTNATYTIRTGNFTGDKNINMSQSGCARYPYISQSATSGEFIHQTQGGIQGDEPPNIDDAEYGIYNYWDGMTVNQTKVFLGGSYSNELVHNFWGWVDNKYWAIGLNESTHNICEVNAILWTDFASINCSIAMEEIGNPAKTDTAPIMYALNETDGFILFPDSAGGTENIWRINYTSGSWDSAYEFISVNQPQTNQIRGVEFFRKNLTEQYTYWQERNTHLMAYVKSIDGGVTFSSPDNTTGIDHAGDTGSERTSIMRYGDNFLIGFSNNTGKNARVYESTDCENWTDTGIEVGSVDTMTSMCLINPKCIAISYSVGSSDTGHQWVEFVNITQLEAYPNASDTPYPSDNAELSGGTTSTYLNVTVHGNQTYDIAFYWENGTYINKSILHKEGDIASIYVTGLQNGLTYNWYTITSGAKLDRWRPSEPIKTHDENQSSTWSFSISSKLQYELNFTSWHTFGNDSQFIVNFTSYHTFGNISKMDLNFTSWHTFGNITPKWELNFTSWHTFGNISQFIINFTSWHTFGNISSNIPPELLWSCPVNNSTNIEVIVSFGFNITDLNGDNMTITLLSNLSGTWIVIDTIENKTDGSHYVAEPDFNEYNTTYYYQVNLSDETGEYSISDIIMFSTIAFSEVTRTFYVLSPMSAGLLAIAIIFILLFIGIVYYVSKKKEKNL